MSKPEVWLWTRLRVRHEDQPPFRRQHPMGHYILDFFCADRNLAIEVDGEGHGYDAQAAHDRARDAWLVARGIEVLRLPASYVVQHLTEAMDTIAAHALERRRVTRTQPRIR